MWFGCVNELVVLYLFICRPLFFLVLFPHSLVIHSEPSDLRCARIEGKFKTLEMKTRTDFFSYVWLNEEPERIISEVFTDFILKTLKHR